MTKLPLSIELEQDCHLCKGMGEIRVQIMGVPYFRAEYEASTCKICKGTGRVPTDAGESLLLFIKRWSEKGAI